MSNENKRKFESIKLGPFTGAYVQSLFVPSALQDGQEPKYGITMLVPKTLDPKSREGKSFDLLKKKIDEAFIKKFGPGDLTKFRKNMAPWKNYPIRDGDVEKSDKPEFAGMYFISARSKTRPALVDRHLQPITDKEEIFSGWQFVLDVGVGAYDIPNKNGKGSTAKGVAVFLNGALAYQEGPRIDSRRSGEEMFKEFEDEAETVEESALD